MKHIKHLLAALAVSAVLVPAFADDASAWTCRARSPTGSWGWGSDYSRAAAASRALRECAIRTPRGYYCQLTSCR